MIKSHYKRVVLRYGMKKVVFQRVFIFTEECMALGEGLIHKNKEVQRLKEREVEMESDR